MKNTVWKNSVCYSLVHRHPRGISRPAVLVNSEKDSGAWQRSAARTRSRRSTSNPQQIQISGWVFHGQHPHCKDLALKKHPLVQKSLPHYQKTPEGCGCPKFLAGRGFLANFDAAGKSYFPAARHARLGHVPAGQWLLENRPRLRERSWMFSSENATAVASWKVSRYRGGVATCATMGHLGPEQRCNVTRRRFSCIVSLKPLLRA